MQQNHTIIRLDKEKMKCSMAGCLKMLKILSIISFIKNRKGQNSRCALKVMRIKHLYQKDLISEKSLKVVQLPSNSRPKDVLLTMFKLQPAQSLIDCV